MVRPVKRKTEHRTSVTVNVPAWVDRHFRVVAKDLSTTKAAVIRHALVERASIEAGHGQPWEKFSSKVARHAEGRL